MSNVHTLLSVVHAVPFALKVSVGQAVLVPVQLSAMSHSPATARHTVPAFPAGCVHVALVPLHTSMVHTLPSSVQVVPLALKTSVGQAVLVPVQVSATSHSAAAARQTVPAALMTSAGQLAPVPVQFSAASHTSTAARQTVLEDRKVSLGQVALVPVQFSATSHTPAEARQTVLEDRKVSLGQVALVPVQFSATSHTPAEARQTVLEDRKVSLGQVALVPVQFSATSQTPADARHTAPAFPAGCVHVALVPLHTSMVHTLPSSAQVVPLALKTSVGQAVLAPVQVSAKSHSAAAARQTVPAALRTSAGQLALVPVQFSAVSHTSTAARQTVLEGRKVSLGQVALVPVQVSALSHTPAAARQTVLEGRKVSLGQVALVPVQVSATSHTPAEARQTVLEDRKVSLGQVALVPSQVSATSQTPADARHTAPAFPAGCVHVAPVPAVTNVHDDVQQDPDWPFCAPRSHCSPESTWPSPHAALKVAMDAAQLRDGLSVPSAEYVPVALTILYSGSIVTAEGVEGVSATSWPMVAVEVVDASAPVAPMAACALSALSEAAAELAPPPLRALNRSLMSDGAPIVWLPPRPKKATSLVFTTVVLMDGAEELARPPEALMGLVVSTLKYAPIPPATSEEEVLKLYGPGSAAAVPAIFRNVAVVRLVPASLVVTIAVQPAGAVIVGVPELARAVIDASMTSFSAVALGRLRLRDVTEPLLLALVAPRNPMVGVPACASAV